MGIFSKSCGSYGKTCSKFGIGKTCRTVGSAQVFAPAPNPLNWELVDVTQYANAYVLTVKYPDCTNFEGLKIMVYKGIWAGRKKKELDPHFQEDLESPIARFKPDTEGKNLAHALAKRLR